MIVYQASREIVDLLNREIDAALSDPVIKTRIAELGAIPLHGNAGALGAMLKQVVELSGIKKE